MPLAHLRSGGYVRTPGGDGAGDVTDGRARRRVVLDRGPHLGRGYVLHVQGELRGSRVFGQARRTRASASSPRAPALQSSETTATAACLPPCPTATTAPR